MKEGMLLKKYILVLLLLLVSIPIIRIRAYTKYIIGEEVTYNGVEYYVIENSDKNLSSVKLLKKDPLTVAEVNLFGLGHVNMYVSNTTNSNYQQATNLDNNGQYTGIGGMAYYTSPSCIDDYSETYECTTDYDQSEIKYVVDAWKEARAPLASDAKLITVDDLTDNLGMELNKTNLTTYKVTVTEDTPEWVMGENYWFWTMSTNTDEKAHVWIVGQRAATSLLSNCVHKVRSAVRPVIVLSKTFLGDEEESSDDINKDDFIDELDDNIESNDDIGSTVVNVENTYKSVILIMIVGFILAGIGVSLVYIVMNKRKKDNNLKNIEK